MLASESVALDILGYSRIADVAPGEAIFISNEGEIFRHQCAANPQLVPCIFEHVYFARPDSIIDDISVYKSRLRMGEHLAKTVYIRATVMRIIRLNFLNFRSCLHECDLAFWENS